MNKQKLQKVAKYLVFFFLSLNLSISEIILDFLNMSEIDFLTYAFLDYVCSNCQSTYSESFNFYKTF